MISAEALCQALLEGLSVDKALPNLPLYEMRYIDRIPVEIYHASQRLGWRFFAVPRLGQPTGTYLRFREATNDIQKLKQWAHSRPRWGLVTGSISGVFVMVVDGMAGQNSLIRACSDNWSWLDTLRTQAGQRRFIFFRWPYGRSQIRGSNYLAEGLYILGAGDWLSTLARANSGCVGSATGEAIRQRGFRRCLRCGTGTARSRVSLRAPLSGAQPAGASQSAASRSAHPRTEPVSRPDPTTNQLQGNPIMNLIELNRSLVQRVRPGNTMVDGSG